MAIKRCGDTVYVRGKRNMENFYLSFYFDEAEVNSKKQTANNTIKRAYTLIGGTMKEGYSDRWATHTQESKGLQ